MVGKAATAQTLRERIKRLWPVEDAATASLMGSFYPAVAIGGRYGAALGVSQRAELKRRPHPAFWSPFVLMGSP